MSYVDRYVHEVCRQLPVKQRVEVENKLRERINVQMQARSSGGSDLDADEKTAQEVLEDLGNPIKLADEYRSSPKCLIGPSLIDTYWLVLRIAMLASVIGLVIALGIQLVVEPPANAWLAVSQFIGGILQAVISAFGMVTLVFALIYHYSGDELAGKKRSLDIKWQISQLPVMPETKILIKRSDTIISIIFALVFLIIINIYPELFGYYRQTDSGITIIPLLGESFKSLLIWINLVMITGIILDIVKTAVGRWTYFLVVTCVGHNIISLIVALRVLQDPDLINPEFKSAISELFAKSGAVLPARWAEYTLSVILVLVIIGFVVESITIIAKAFRLAQIKLANKAGGPDDKSAIK